MYYLISKEKAVARTKEGRVEACHPSCFSDLEVYVSYLNGRGREEEVQHLLRRIFKGERAISQMVADMQKIKLD